MILRVEDIQGVCSKILAAVESNELSQVTESLEITAENKILKIAVTNEEYYVEFKLPLLEEVSFKATVNANLFLKLISQITTDTVFMQVDGNNLLIEGNGKYKLPLIFANDTLLELPEINISNVTNEFNIDAEVLNSILLYNGKELTKGVGVNPVQKLYYVDNKGAITFISGACVNTFKLPQPVKMLLNGRLVKLFKLFNSGVVNFKMGHDALNDDVVQTKVEFSNETVRITAVLSCDDTLLSSVPVDAIRGRANEVYPYVVNINREELLESINRLLLFGSGFGSKEVLKPYGRFSFDANGVTLYDVYDENFETVLYSQPIDGAEYETYLDLKEMKITLEGCSEQYLTLCFGASPAIVIIRGHITNIIPEVHNAV